MTPEDYTPIYCNYCKEEVSLEGNCCNKECPIHHLQYALDLFSRPSIICPDCNGPIDIRNPTGECDHLYYPEYKISISQPASPHAMSDAPCKATGVAQHGVPAGELSKDCISSEEISKDDVKYAPGNGFVLTKDGEVHMKSYWLGYTHAGEHLKSHSQATGNGNYTHGNRVKAQAKSRSDVVDGRGNGGMGVRIPPVSAATESVAPETALCDECASYQSYDSICWAETGELRCGCSCHTGDKQ